MAFNRKILILISCIIIAIIIMVPMLNSFLHRSSQHNISSLGPSSLSFQRMNNTLPVLEVGISLSKYFKNAVEFKPNRSLPENCLIFVNLTLAGKYESFLLREINRGVPVIFVGNLSKGEKELTKILENCSGIIAIPKKLEGVSCWIYGIAKDPSKKIPGIPAPTNVLSVGGNGGKEEEVEFGKGILLAYNWAYRNFVERDLSSLQYYLYVNGSLPSWIWIGSLDEVFYCFPYGEMSIFTNYFVLYDSSWKNSTYLLIHVVHRVTPGEVSPNGLHYYQEGWKVCKFFEKISSQSPEVALSNYHPSTVFNVHALPISFFVMSVENPYIMKWDFSVGPPGVQVNVYDYSDFADNTAWWIWKVERTPKEAFYLQVQPGAVMKVCLNPGSKNVIKWAEEYGVQFAKKSKMPWEGEKSQVYSCESLIIVYWGRSLGRLEEIPSAIFLTS